MSRIRCSQISTRTTSLCLSAVVALSFSLATAQFAHSLQCGDNITTNTTLTADLGPCPNLGLSVDGIAGPVTLDLNGHSITGSGAGTGLLVGGVSPGLTIKGRGRVVNFATGILMAGAGDVLVYDVVLIRNQAGISINNQQPGTIRVMNNRIAGEAQGQIGVTLANAGPIYVYHNEISGHSVDAVSVMGETTSVVDENLITLNQAGIVVSAPDLACYDIRGNRVALNRGNGIQMGPHSDVSPDTKSPSTTTCGSIEDNTVNRNGGSGIVIVAGPYSPLVQDNMVSYNQVDGIGVSGTAIEGSVQVIGNRVLHNGTDLFWNGAGTSNCWSQNIFVTSNPQSLPPCQ